MSKHILERRAAPAEESRFALMEEHAQVWDILIELL
jgi:hypothetical protein